MAQQQEPDWPVLDGFHLAEDQNAPITLWESVEYQFEVSRKLSAKAHEFSREIVADAARSDRSIAAVLKREREPLPVLFGQLSLLEKQTIAMTRAWFGMTLDEREAWLLTRRFRDDPEHIRTRGRARFGSNAKAILLLGVSVERRLEEIEKQTASEYKKGSQRISDRELLSVYLETTQHRQPRKNRRFSRAHSLTYEYTPAKMEAAIVKWASSRDRLEVKEVTVWLKKKDALCTKREREVRASQQELAVHLTLMGFPDRMIGRRLGVSGTKIGQIRKSAGIDAGKTGPKPRYRDDYRNVGSGRSDQDRALYRGPFKKKVTWTQLVRIEKNRRQDDLDALG